MERNTSLGADSIDWADPAFSGAEFQDSMLAESPWGNSALNDFTNLADYSDSPAALGLRTPSKSGPDAASTTTSQPQPPQLPHSHSADSSSADSASDSSGGRKRKTASQSVAIKEESMMNTDDFQTPSAFQQTFSQPMPRLAVDQPMADSQTMFDFNSAASSPNLPRDFNQQLSLDATNNLIPANAAGQFAQDSPVRTINPGMFTLGGSRDQSPATNSAIFNAASPNNFFSTPSSDSNEPFNPNQTWGGLTANPAWPADLTNQFASPAALNFTPSPVANGGTPSMASRGTPTRLGRTVLHIAPISAKSRVETQINVAMTLEKPPFGVEHLHLPLHTIAKSKLLAKEEYDPAKVLELHTMLVCSSAMHNPAIKEKALHKAASQNNEEIQRRAEQEREDGDEEKNNMKNIEESDKPSNGGEVRICNNCIQRERKRAGRKKLKKEEEQQHWERYETERVVVFNSSEYLPFKPYEQRDQSQKDSLAADETYDPPPGALSVSAAMRIACYCRHQSEKEGFQVIFTMKDHLGNVVAQEMSDSILITDDHKTHPSTLPQLSNEVYYQPSQMGSNGLPSSYSMVDLQSHAQPFTSSRSAGNLQALAFGQQLQFNPHSHVHQLPGSLNTGFASQATSATMTPTNLSRPGSPTLAGQAGPNKKRKSGSFHKRLPSGLQMTPRVDTSQNQPASATLSSGLSASLSTGLSLGNFSPTRGVFGGANDPAYMTLPQSSGSYYGSGPSTPAANDNAQFQFGQPHQLDIARAQNSAYFSHPSSAVPSRSNSPVLQHSRLNMSTFQRQPIQTPTNSLSRPSSMFGGQAAAGAMSNPNSPGATPTITKITPNEGPSAGGTEVSIYGYNFTNNTQVLFGDTVAVTRTLYGSKSILAVAPPGRRGPVRVTVVTEVGPSISYSSAPNNNHVYTYTETNPLMMKMALQFLSQQQTGDAGQWQQYTTEVANQFMQTSISPAGIHGQGYGGGDVFKCNTAVMEQIILRIFDIVDASEIPRQPCYDLRSSCGHTMLSLATASGMHQVVAALLARGANPDVRDRSGYTPLMQAGLHEQPKTLPLLLVKGADPTMRSLAGYAALDLVPEHSQLVVCEIIQTTQRSRISARPPYHRITSNTSSEFSLDMSSASIYDSETGTHSVTTTRSLSRRPSTTTPHLHTANAPPETLPSTSIAAMTAWRDTLATQIDHFQHTVQNSMSSFQLPALPPLPDYQDNAMVRRLSSFVSSKYSDMFCLSPMAPPPAYEDLFPHRAGAVDAKERAVEVAVVDTVAEEKCATLFQDTALEPSAELTARLMNSPKTPEVWSERAWFWMALLVALGSLLCSMWMVTNPSEHAVFRKFASRPVMGCPHQIVGFSGGVREAVDSF